MMAANWPTTSWELGIHYDCLDFSNGFPLPKKYYGKFHVYAADEKQANVSAHAHMRLLLTSLGIEWK